MTITINDMVAVNRFLNEHCNDKINIKTAFKFNKLATSMESDMKLFQEKYAEIITKYKNPDSENQQEGTFSIKEENLSDYIHDMDELAAVEVDVADVKFSIDELDGFSLSMEELRPLLPFIAD